MKITLALALMPVMVCAVWSIIFLLDYLLRRAEERKFLLFFMSAATFLYVGHYFFFIRTAVLIPYTDTLYGMCQLSVYPLYLIYIVYLTTGHVGLRQWTMLVPGMLLACVYAVLYTLMDSVERQEFICQYLYGNTRTGLSGTALVLAWAHDVSKVVFFALVALVCWRGTARIHDFGRQVASAYADTEGRTLKPVRVLLLLFTFTSVVSVVFLVLGRSRFANSEWLLAIPSVLFTTLLFSIGYVGSQSMFSYREYVQENDEPASKRMEEDTTEPSAYPVRVESLAKEIERLMTEEKMFREHDLHITEVARRLGTNSKYVSMAINQVLGHSFSDYVNDYRIQYVRELQHQHPDMAVTEIAHKAGYSSMQSFYRNLKLRGG